MKSSASEPGLINDLLGTAMLDKKIRGSTYLV